MNTAVGSGWATPTNAIVRSTKRWAKSRKKGQKCHPHCLAFVTNNSGVGEEIESSNEEFVATVEHDFKRHSRPPKGHFGMILEATYPHHPYHAKNKLRDCTMMRRFMTSGHPLVAMSQQETQKEMAWHSFLRRQKLWPSLTDYDPGPGTLCG
jgi:hypothetical protein